jgi:aminopeptidase N
MNRWIGKHPIPLDFFNTFENVLGEDLSWFWKPWFYEMGYPDLGIASVSQIEDDVEVTIEKIGNIPTRVELNLVFEDGTSEKITKSAREWINGNKTLSIFINSDKKINNITLGNSEIPDVNKENNSKEI